MGEEKIHSLYLQRKDTSSHGPSVYRKDQLGHHGLHINPNNLSYADVEHFLRFINKYVSQAVGNNTYARWKKSNQTKTLLDKISASDIAYIILVYENARRCGKKS